MPTATAPASRKEHVLADSAHVRQERHKLAVRLLSFRAEHKIPRRVVASLIGCSQSNIKCIEAESNSPSYALALTLEKLLALKAHSVRRLIAEMEIPL